MAVRGTTRDRRHLRRFGLTVGTGFMLIGALSSWRDHTLAPRIFLAIATMLAVPALVAPAVLAPVERAWLTVGGWLAWVNTRILLTVMFYAVVTPIAVLMGFFRDPLDRRLDEARKSYWIRRPAVPFDAKAYYRQF